MGIEVLVVSRISFCVSPCITSYMYKEHTEIFNFLENNDLFNGSLILHIDSTLLIIWANTS